MGLTPSVFQAKLSINITINYPLENDSQHRKEVQIIAHCEHRQPCNEHYNGRIGTVLCVQFDSKRATKDICPRQPNADFSEANRYVGKSVGRNKEPCLHLSHPVFYPATR